MNKNKPAAATSPDDQQLKSASLNGAQLFKSYLAKQEQHKSPPIKMKSTVTLMTILSFIEIMEV